MRFYANKIEMDPEAGLSHETLAALKKTREPYDQVIACYLGEGISLGRAAELLALPWLDLRTRFLRLDAPILVGPDQPAEVLAEIHAIKQWEGEDAAPVS